MSQITPTSRSPLLHLFCASAPAKDETNRTKHGVGFEEAATVFADRFALSWADTQHSVAEYRMLTLGYTDRGRLAIVAHTERSEGIRIITARLAEYLVEHGAPPQKAG